MPCLVPCEDLEPAVLVALDSRAPHSYFAPMNDTDRIEALLDLVDETRSADADVSQQLVVLGLAERRGRAVLPTNAGWSLMGDRGRVFEASRH